jgi:UDP-N-acetylmuramyl pentapeptide synthase
MKLNDVAQLQEGKKLLNPYVTSKLELHKGEILPEEWFMAIIRKRGHNYGARGLQKGIYNC